MSLNARSGVAFEETLSRVKTADAGDDARAALATLFASVTPDSDFVDQARAARALKRLHVGSLGLRPLRVALVAGSTLDHFAPVLRFWLARMGFDAEVALSPFDTAVQSVLDPSSALRRSRPDIVWLFSTYRDLGLDVRPGSTVEQVQEQVGAAVESRCVLWRQLTEHLGCTVIDNLVDVPAEDPFGNLSGSAPWGLRAMLRRYNVDLAAAAPSAVALFDLDHVASLWGRRRWEDARYWFHSKHAFALDATGNVAHAAARLIAGARGLAKKCLVLDLDNTLWGGVIGDDGLAGIELGHGEAGEAFVALHRFVKALKDRGVILAVCSKNDPDMAASVFREHPDSVLRFDDFAVFVANWRNKADNIREIAAALNIGLDSLVFMDDNPMERDIVRRHLPEVEVIDLPEDPSGYVAALARPRWFETVAFSAEDRERGRYYADNAQRTAFREDFVDLASYLRGLDMEGAMGGADSFHQPRMAQLINKSNQFHLTGTRYSEAELSALAASPDCFVRHMRLADRFGDSGLIACVVLRRRDRAMHIDTWVMSCRVLGRTVEEFIANDMRAIALAQGCDRLVGRYVRSGKNGLVADLYERLGFTSGNDGEWTFALDPARPGWTSWVRPAQEKGQTR
ncbi:MAG: HAD family hydrolase [Proteobacteria bacterium]|nr:HAD family hydrolase [Pseudomonadota bacterium]